MSVLDITSMVLGNQVQEFKEVWRMVSGFPGDPYRVSISGRVQSRWVRSGWGERVIGDGTFWCDLNGSHNGDGRLMFNLYDGNGGGRRTLVYRIVLEEFVGPCLPGQEACHWDTHTDNEEDKVRHETDRKGERNPMALLTWEKVDRIRGEFAAGGCTKKELAKKNGVSEVNISLIVGNKRWIRKDYSKVI